MYTKIQKDRILSYLKKHTFVETYKKFKISPDTLKYWTNAEHRQQIQQKERSKYKPNEPKRTYTRTGNTEAQRISAQIKRAIKRVPKVQYSSEDIKQELQGYAEKSGRMDATVQNNKCILHYQQHFYEKERELFSDPVIARKIIKNRSKYLFKEPKDLSDNELLRGFKISGTYYGFSHFSPLWFKWFIETYKPQSVLDPCGGWGHRLLGTLGTDLKTYIYNDFDERTYESCLNIYTEWKALFSATAMFVNGRAERMDVSNISYDSIFTCPPYFNKELYNNTSFKDIEDFSQWWSSVVNNCYKETLTTIGVVIDPENADIISKPIIEKGFILDSEHDIKSKESHFTTTKIKDKLLVFIKNH